MSAIAQPPARAPHEDGARACRIAVVVDDDRTRNELLATLASGGLPVNADALTLHRVAELAGDPPDALVLSADLMRASGLAALRRARAQCPSARIVVVAAAADAASAARECLNAGADAFVPGAAMERMLVAAVHAVIAGFVCVPRKARRLLAKPAFSHREKEVLGLLVDGLTNRQIASRLFLAESTVKSHLASAFAKLGVRSRKDAVALLLDPAEGLAATALAPEATDRLVTGAATAQLDLAIASLRG
jgi:DNA-binding NarL/FixJ family response regulator